MSGFTLGRSGGVLYVHKWIKVVVFGIKDSFRTEEVPVRVSSDNSSEGIRYIDSDSKMFYKKIYNKELQPFVPEYTWVAKRFTDYIFTDNYNWLTNRMRCPISELASISQVLQQ